MNVWVDRCNKSTICRFCKDRIEKGEMEIFGRAWLRSGEGEQRHKWSKTYHWHASHNGKCCWLEEQYKRYEENPYVETRGRKRIIMSKDKRAKRLSILRRRAKTVQQIRAIMDEPFENRDMDKLVKLGIKMEGLKHEIESYGGAPKSWD